MGIKSSTERKQDVNQFQASFREKRDTDPSPFIENMIR